MVIINKFLLGLICICFLSSCAEFKDSKNTIGHAAKDISTSIGHGVRDSVKAISKDIKKIDENRKNNG